MITRQVGYVYLTDCITLLPLGYTLGTAKSDLKKNIFINILKINLSLTYDYTKLKRSKTIYYAWIMCNKH